jgi:hypothetical protein
MAVLHSEGQQPRTLSLSFNLYGSGRFTLETNIRAELEASPAILLVAGTGNYIYENKTECWFIPTKFTITDNAQALKCSLDGVVDEYTIHSCDITTHWSGTGIVLTTDTRFGAKSIGSQQTTDTFVCDLSTNPVNLSQRKYISLWHKVEPSTFTTLQLEVHSAGGNYVWELDVPTTAGWVYQQCDLAAPDSTVGTPSLSVVTSVKIVYIFAT